MVLEKHVRYYVRELRIKAYSQFLESYKSVTIKSLADAFGVGENFLERYGSHFKQQWRTS
jgi:26S proteasome regulatory subunit N7